jgi:hypothetical protein
MDSALVELSPGFSNWRRGITVLTPAILWIWLCRDWPARLGFYSDDWMILLHPFVGTADAFRDITNLVATRPVSAPFIWFAQVFVDWNPAKSQILNAVMLLVTAASVGMLTGALISAIRPLRAGALVGASIASAAFIVFPSSVGTFAWNTGVTTAVPTVPLFCLATSLLLHSEGSRWRLVLGLAIALLSHLSYEAFYFQEVTFISLAAVLGKSKLNNSDWQSTAGAILVNIVALFLIVRRLAGSRSPFTGISFTDFYGLTDTFPRLSVMRRANMQC